MRTDHIANGMLRTAAVELVKQHGRWWPGELDIYALAQGPHLDDGYAIASIVFKATGAFDWRRRAEAAEAKVAELEARLQEQQKHRHDDRQPVEIAMIKDRGFGHMVRATCGTYWLNLNRDGDLLVTGGETMTDYAGMAFRCWRGEAWFTWDNPDGESRKRFTAHTPGLAIQAASCCTAERTDEIDRLHMAAEQFRQALPVPVEPAPEAAAITVAEAA